MNANKILIVGAGIGGLSASLALAQRGFQVEVFEQAPGFDEIGAGIQISPNAMKVFMQLGVDRDLEALSFEPEAAYVRHYQTGNTFFTTPFKKICRSRYGAPYLHVHRADLHKVLFDSALASNVHIHLDSKINNYTQSNGHVSVQLDNAVQHQGDVLVGADGVRSAIQEQMLGKEEPRFTGQVAWRGVLPVERVPSNLVAPGVTVWVGPGRHIVIYYLRGGRLINFVAVEERSDWQSESWSQAGDVNELRKAFRGWRPEVNKILSLVDETYLWALFDRKPLKTWSDAHVTLLGDACHPMLPFMAQGAAMAIEDAYVLAECLGKEPQNIPRALEHYEQLRKPRTTMLQKDSRANADIYHMKGGVMGRLRLSLIKTLTKTVPSLADNKLDSIYGFDVTS